MSTNPAAFLPPLGPIYGAYYFGAIVSTAFYGITCMQTFFYYIHYQNDPKRIKIFVAALWTLNTINEALGVSGVYKFIMAGLATPSSVLSNGNPELVFLFIVLTHFSTGWSVNFFQATVAIPSQGFFIYRIFIFGRMKIKIIAPLTWVILTMIQLVCAIIYVANALYSANGIHVVSLNVLNDTFMTVRRTLGTLCLSVTAGMDILITVFLTFLLVRQLNATCFANTAHILQRLIVFAVNTGAWTAACALLTLILLNVFPTNALYVVPGMPLCAVYCNTTLANLNARAYLGGGETANMSSMDLFSDSGSQVSESAQI